MGIKNTIKNIPFIYNPLHAIMIGANQIPVRIGGIFRENGLCLNGNYKELQKYKDVYKNKRCFLIANGPSLTVDDLNLLKGEYTFGCNKIFYLFDKSEWRPTFYCVLDEDYIAKYQDEIFSYIDMPVFTNNVIAKRLKPENKERKTILYSQQIMYSNFKAWPNLMSYTYATKQGTIMSFVMAVALYMGFSEINVLGMDNTSTTAGNHFVGYKEDKSLEANLNRRIKENGWDANHWKNQTEIEMSEFRKYADSNGIKIYNVTRGGKLEVFPRRDLDECFEQIKK